MFDAAQKALSQAVRQWSSVRSAYPQWEGVGGEWVQSLSASGLATLTAPVKPCASHPYLRLDRRAHGQTTGRDDGLVTPDPTNSCSCRVAGIFTGPPFGLHSPPLPCL